MAGRSARAAAGRHPTGRERPNAAGPGAGHLPGGGLSRRLPGARAGEVLADYPGGPTAGRVPGPPRSGADLAERSGQSGDPAGCAGCGSGGGGGGGGGNGPPHLAAPPRLEPLAELLQEAGFELQPAEDLQGLVWGKLAINAGINPLTALLEVPNGELLVRPGARQLMRAAAQETAAVAAARGLQLPYPDVAARVEEVAQRTASNVSSMLQDIRRGAPTEIDAISGAVVREGERHGALTPLNWTLWNLVRAKVNGSWPTA